MRQYPQARDARRELGISYYQQHSMPRRGEQFEALQAIDPDDLAAHYNLAVLYRRMGMKKKAAEQAALFADKQVDPGAPTYSLDYLRKHPEISVESVPWHMHKDADGNDSMAGDGRNDAMEFVVLIVIADALFARSAAPRWSFPFGPVCSRRCRQQTTARSDRTRLSCRAKARSIRDRSRRSKVRRSASALSMWSKQSGLAVKTIYGGEHKNKYLLETTGCGLAFYDYDNDGWLDVFLVNGWRLEGFPARAGAALPFIQEQSRRHVHGCDQGLGAGAQNRLGAGLLRRRLQQRRPRRSVRHLLRAERAVPQSTANGTFTDVTKEAGLDSAGSEDTLEHRLYVCGLRQRRTSGSVCRQLCGFRSENRPAARGRTCTYKGLLVACGPPGLPGGKNILYHNNGNGTFTDVSEKAGIWNTAGTYGLSVAASDLDNDGWPDIYVANDSSTATLYQNQKDGTFKDIAIESGAALSPEGKPQAGMGVSIGDYNRDGNLDVVKTNFAGDTDSLYTNLGDANFEDRTYPSGTRRQHAIVRLGRWILRHG